MVEENADAVIDNPELDNDVNADGSLEPGVNKPDDQGDGLSDDGKGSQPVKGGSVGVRKRVDKLRGKVAEVQAQKGKVEEDLELERKKNEILQMQVEQMGAAKKVFAEPNPDDYPGGSVDPDYESDTQVFNERKIKDLVAETVRKANEEAMQNQAATAADIDLRQKQEAHYTQVEGLGVADYDAAEEKALDTLGLDAVNAIIKNFSKDSAPLIYRFGKNLKEAEEFRSLWHTDKVQAVAKIGGILAENKANPNTELAIEPDLELEGGSSSSNEFMQKKLDKMRAKSRSGDPAMMEKILEFKKQAKAKGVKLE